MVTLSPPYTRQFEGSYYGLAECVLQDIAQATGCLAPCSYREYRSVGTDLPLTVSPLLSLLYCWPGELPEARPAAVEHFTLSCSGEGGAALPPLLPRGRVWGHPWAVYWLLLHGPLGRH